MKPICIKVIAGPPGSGKSMSIMDDIVAHPRNVLWATARRDFCDEQAESLQSRSIKSGRYLIVETIHSDQPAQKASVARRVAEALQAVELGRERVLLITHESLFNVDPHILNNWHVVIDEIPAACVSSGKFHAPITWQSLKAHYHLIPTEQSNSYRVKCRDDIASVSSSMLSKETNEISAFHKIASKKYRNVFVNVASWDDVGRDQAPVSWWSIWTPFEIRNAASITFAASGYFESLVCLASKKFNEENIIYEKMDLPASSSRAMQKWTIHYYTRHKGSTAYWDKPEGRLGLVEISRHLEQIGFSGFWSCNASIENFFFGRIAGDQCSPKQAGTNSLRHHQACAYIYSNKAQESDEAIMGILGIDAETVLFARESEDIIQFVMRGQVRESSYDGHYTVHLYSDDQAEMLKQYLLTNKLAGDVILVPEEGVGLMDITRPCRKEVSNNFSIPSQIEKGEDRRKKDAARKRDVRDRLRTTAILEGSYKPPGRPRKSL